MTSRRIVCQRGGGCRAGDYPTDPDSVIVIALESRWRAVGSLLTLQLDRPLVHRRRLQKILAPGKFGAVVFHNLSLMGAPEILGSQTGAIMAYMAHDAVFRDARAARTRPAAAEHYAEDVVVPRLVALLESAVARGEWP